ncbi:trehalase-like domain-containing protein [Streptomyces atacamensis]|uniref:trehalase-like domain-containing protein n=1 Tax=Streptomyces atacamensis TaxID=531966 RepID=UPI00399D1B14
MASGLTGAFAHYRGRAREHAPCRTGTRAARGGDERYERRRRNVFGQEVRYMTGTPIEDYGLLSDRHSAALVSRGGAVDWLCFPRFDSPSVFAALLGDKAGTWSVHPAGPAETSRRYLDGTMVLRTEFATATGTLAVTDALATGASEDPHRLGAHAPHLLIRSLACTGGTVEAVVDFRPRPEYGLVIPMLARCDGGVTARGGAVSLALSSPVPLTPYPGGASGTVDLEAGQEVGFALHWGPLSGPAPRVRRQGEIADQLTVTVDAWRK